MRSLAFFRTRAVGTGAAMAIPHFGQPSFFTPGGQRARGLCLVPSLQEYLMVRTRGESKIYVYLIIMAFKPEDIGDIPLEPFQPVLR